MVALTFPITFLPPSKYFKILWSGQNPSRILRKKKIPSRISPTGIIFLEFFTTPKRYRKKKELFCCRHVRFVKKIKQTTTDFLLFRLWSFIYIFIIVTILLLGFSWFFVNGISISGRKKLERKQSSMLWELFENGI